MSGPSPKSMALRFRIWQYAEPRGWGVTIPEIAEALGVGVQSAVAIIRHAGWSNRVRKVSPDYVRGPRWMAGGHIGVEASAVEREIIRDHEHGLL